MSTAATATPSPNGFRLNFKIAKVDQEKRLVRGVCTSEDLDAHGEIVDYPTFKDVVTRTWAGNVREMHQAKAVGKKTEIVFDDEHKQAILEAYVSKGAPDTWEKVKDGTLSMYSIGGTAEKRVTEKIGDTMAKRLFVASIDEISLVDAGACPAAKFDIVKMTDGKVEELQPEDPIDEPVKKSGPEPWDVGRAAQLIAALNDLLASEMWELAMASPGSDASAQSAQVEMLKGCVLALIAFLSSEFAEQFAAAKTVGVAAPEDDAPKLARVLVLGTSAMGVAKALATAIDKAGTRPSDYIAIVQKAHDAVADLGAACHAVKDEGDVEAQQLAERVAAEKVAKTLSPELQALVAGMAESGMGYVEVTATLTDGRTVDARVLNHETVDGLPDGATASDITALVRRDKASTPNPNDEAIQKLREALTSATTLLEEQKATAAAQAATIAALKTDVETLKAQPAAGGPKVRVVPGTAVTVVEKTLGAVPNPDDIPVEVMQKAFEKLAQEATNEPDRLAIARAAVATIHKLGPSSR